VEVGNAFPKSITLKEVVEERNNRVRPFADEMAFVNQKVHLLWNALATDPKYSTLARHEEVDGAWLQGIARQVNLLRVVKAVMHGEIWTAAGSAALQLSEPMSAAVLPCLIHHGLVEGPLFLYLGEVLLLLLQLITGWRRNAL
jgi:hypothetical protein